VRQSIDSTKQSAKKKILAKGGLKKSAAKKGSAQARVAVTNHDHTPELKRLSRIKGQVEGIERMITGRRYCPEIVLQIKAARSALKGLETSIIEGHVLHCVKHAIESGDAYVVQQKVDEVLNLVRGQS
jgi:DNA-binding FrmR family transcriptional regulator